MTNKQHNAGDEREQAPSVGGERDRRNETAMSAEVEVAWLLFKDGGPAIHLAHKDGWRIEPCLFDEAEQPTRSADPDAAVRWLTSQASGICPTCGCAAMRAPVGAASPAQGAQDRGTDKQEKP